MAQERETDIVGIIKRHHALRKVVHSNKIRIMNTLSKLATAIVVGLSSFTLANAKDNAFYVGGTLPVEFGGKSTYTGADGTPIFDNAPNSTELDMLNDVGGGLNIQFGYDFGAIRTELEIGQRRTNIDKISLVDGIDGSLARLSDEDGYTQNSRIMLNAFYDMELSPRWGLYFGAGAGYNKTKGEIKGTLGGESILINYTGDNELSYQTLFGVTFAASEKIDLTFGYRRVWTDDPKFNDAVIEASSPESFEFGIRYNF